MAGKDREVARTSEGARRATVEVREARGGDMGRFSARRKSEVVLRLVRGESLDSLSRELGVTGARLSQWREAFLTHGAHGLKSRLGGEDDDGEKQRLQAKIGELTMEVELLNKKIDVLETGRPLATRRSRR